IAATRPPSERPSATATSVSSCAPTSTGSQSGASAASTPPSSRTRAPRKRSGRQKSTTPALNASPRSTRGTIRTIAYWKGSARAIGLLHPGAVALQSGGEVTAVGGRLAPVGRQLGGDRLQPG